MLVILILFFITVASLAFFKFSNCFSVNIRFGLISGLISGLTSCLISSSSACVSSGSISGSGTGTGSIFLFSRHYIIYKLENNLKQNYFLTFKKIFKDSIRFDKIR